MEDLSSQRIDLDDSRIVTICRERGFLNVVLEQRRGTEVRNLSARVVGPYQEEVAYYVGEGITAPHPDPSLPLDFVEYAALGPCHLDLQGYRRNESWFAWRISGSAVVITGLVPAGSAA